MLVPWSSCPSLAIVLPCACHVLAMLLPCACHACSCRARLLPGVGSNLQLLCRCATHDAEPCEAARATNHRPNNYFEPYFEEATHTPTTHTHTHTHKHTHSKPHAHTHTHEQEHGTSVSIT
jgi:hypothetical protein